MPRTEQAEEVREAPHNDMAEKAVLGCVMVDNTTLATAQGILVADDFYNLSHRRIFLAMGELEKAGMNIDPIALMEFLGDDFSMGFDALMALEASVMTTSLVSNHALIVREHSLRRQIVALASKTGDELSMGGDLQAQVAELQTKLMEIQNTTATGRARHISKAARETFDWILETRESGGMTGVPTGFPRLDKLTNGWQRGDMVVLAARPSVGKTALAMDFLRTCCAVHNQRAIMFSLEMSERALMQRIQARESGVFLGKLRAPKELEERDLYRVADACEAISKWPLMCDDTPANDISTIRARAREYQQRHPDLALIVIDYLQIIEHKGASRNDNNQIKVAQISGRIKQLARECNVPVIVLSQLSRSVEQRGKKEEPRLSDLRDSGAIEQDADLVIFLHRPVSVQEAADSRAVPIKLMVEKNRQGSCGTVNLIFDGPLMRYDELLTVEPEPEYGTTTIEEADDLKWLR